ncbi:hypothetical protein SCHPADRAFT_525324 [Schizopora paradoxa]|uniref:Uncharacterized protein n=1 Tax=Schizopora paradoxa TaxID=27342 RepID=A0A0H2RFJ6_9AGAM|nr:hypothetical protein SCHPADRAFT_525324 [Schizopora paradoxa]
MDFRFHSFFPFFLFFLFFFSVVVLEVGNGHCCYAPHMHASSRTHPPPSSNPHTPTLSLLPVYLPSSLSHPNYNHNQSTSSSHNNITLIFSLSLPASPLSFTRSPFPSDVSMALYFIFSSLSSSLIRFCRVRLQQRDVNSSTAASHVKDRITTTTPILVA